MAKMFLIFFISVYNVHFVDMNLVEYCKPSSSASVLLCSFLLPCLGQRSPLRGRKCSWCWCNQKWPDIRAQNLQSDSTEGTKDKKISQDVNNKENQFISQNLKCNGLWTLI